jgi:dienelactone hydrolase
VDFLHQFFGFLCRKRTGNRFRRHLAGGWLDKMVRKRTFGAAVFTEKCGGFDSPWLWCAARTVKPAAGPIPPQVRFMQSLKAFFALLVLAAFCAPGAMAQTQFGAQGAEGPLNRAQQWLVPTPDPKVASHAVLYRPPGDGPFPLALIAHASTQNVLRRAQMPQPEYRALSAWLVARGYAVLVPERPGHGGTGGPYLEDQGGCDEANYSRAGYATADSISAALDYLRSQSFIRPDGAVVVGHSAGGWGALALASGNPKGVSLIIAFAPGRGGQPNDTPNQVCAPHTLMSSAAEFGEDARVPVIWLVAANDGYFSPALSRQLADAFRGGGDKVDFRALAASGSEGHWLAETDAGAKIYGPVLDSAIKAAMAKPAKKP